MLVLIATGVSSLIILGQLQSQQASFDLLTGVYVPFNADLSKAHIQDVRISMQFSLANERLLEAQKLSSQEESLFAPALAERRDMVLRARRIVDDAFRNPDRIGGAEALEELAILQGALNQLVDAVTMAEAKGPAEALRDIRTQNEIDGLFRFLEEESSRAIQKLQGQVRHASRDTERLTIRLLFGASLLALIALLAVIWTLRPLRKLTEGVRRLGRGDWGQRVKIRAAGAPRLDEVSQLAHEFNLMAEALQERERRLIRNERMAAVGQLAAQVTHEIRNPLSSMTLNVELLEDEIDNPSPEARQLLGHITSEVDRLTQITGEYLQFARRQKPERLPMDLIPELESLLDFLEEEHEQADIEVRRELPVEPQWILGDANQLRRAFMNLLRNAREALSDVDERAEPAQLRVRVVRRGEVVVVEIADNGPGLPEDDAERIFEAFFTRKAQGTGLGLAIVQQIVSDHEGGIEVARTGPQGTSFEVTLPACDPPNGSVFSPSPRSSA
ncbi:MAG: HAMP domain-containing protein [Myxococcales bacterium]|nr:HAMP domain-containing protein [Myxococcales bacterium]